MPESESLVIGRVVRLIQRGELVKAVDELRVLQERVMRGVHRNPPLAISRHGRKRHYQSEVVGELSREVHAILYRHIEDGRQYRHDFEHRTSLLTLFDGQRSDVLITSPDGFPIWQDF